MSLFILFGQHTSSAILRPLLIQVCTYGLGINNFKGGLTQLINSNEDKAFLLGVRMLFIALNVRSHSHKEMATVLTANVFIKPYECSLSFILYIAYPCVLLGKCSMGHLER
ncbi:hypothetical protein QTP88_018912 [Uroleucon formosanum]